MSFSFSRLTRHLNHSVRESLFVFLLSRTTVLLIFIVVGQLKFGPPEPGSGPGEMGSITGRNAIISLSNAPIAQTLREIIAQGDVNHYVNLSQDGYDRRPFGSDTSKPNLYGFCPVLPALLWLIGKLGFDVLIGGSVLSSLFFFGALIILHNLVIAAGYDESTASRALFYIAFFPTSYFFSLPMTESVFLLLTVASFYAAMKNSWLASGTLGALASATRLNGLLLLPALFGLWLARGKPRSFQQVMGLALVPLGLIVFMFLSWQWSGNPLAPAEAPWGRRPGFFLMPLWDYLRQPGTVGLPWNFISLNFLVALLAFAAIYFLIRQQQRALALYVALMVLLPLSTSTLISMTRYMSVVFPIFIALGALGKSARIDQTIRTIFIALFVLLTALFAARFTLALT